MSLRANLFQVIVTQTLLVELTWTVWDVTKSQFLVVRVTSHACARVRRIQGAVVPPLRLEPL